MIVILAILIIFAIVAFIFTKDKKKKEPDFLVFFVLGLVWLIIGLISDSSELLILGLIFFISGLSNKDKWWKNKNWSELNEEERKIRIIGIFIFVILILAVTVAFLFIKGG